MDNITPFDRKLSAVRIRARDGEPAMSSQGGLITRYGPAVVPARPCDNCGSPMMGASASVAAHRPGDTVAWHGALCDRCIEIVYAIARLRANDGERAGERAVRAYLERPIAPPPAPMGHQVWSSAILGAGRRVLHVSSNPHVIDADQVVAYLDADGGPIQMVTPGAFAAWVRRMDAHPSLVRPPRTAWRDPGRCAAAPPSRESP